MSRWEPNAHGRLLEAALELYQKRGFDQTTVAEIAARAGVTERTYFRYFADKREVLFYGASALEKAVVERLGATPSAAPLAAVATALEAGATLIEERTGHDLARQRHRVISGHAELRERELIKLASLAEAIARTLKERGVRDPAATLAAEAGVAAFKVAFEQWVESTKKRGLVATLRACVTELGSLAARETPKRLSSSARRAGGGGAR